MKVSSVVARVRLDLSDCDKSAYAWKTPHIVDVINDMMCQLFALRHDLFMRPITVEFLGGDLLDLSACCDMIKSVEGVVDGSGQIIKRLVTSSSDNESNYTRIRKCRGVVTAITGGLPDAAQVVSGSGQYVRLTPAMPTGKTIKLRVWCASRPKATTATGTIDLPCELYDDLLRMVESRLLGVENDSPSSMAASDRLLAQAGVLIKGKRDARKDAKKDSKDDE